MTVFMSGQLLLRSVMEERTNRTIEILLSSVTPKELMSGKILGLGALGLAQIIFYLIAALSITYHKNLAVIELSQIPFFLIYFISGYLFYASIFAAMGTFFSSEQDNKIKFFSLTKSKLFNTDAFSEINTSLFFI